jgi:hypothetical protein
MLYPTITHAQMTSQARRNVTLTAKDFLNGPFFLTATEIDGTNAHLSFLPDATHPILTMDSSTIYGLKITHPITSNLTLVITSTSTAPATSTGVAIQTSFSDLAAGSVTSVDPAVLLELLAGDTVSSITIKNENLTIDTYLNSSTISIPDAQISIQ